MKLTLEIQTVKEASDEEVEIIKQAFTEYFEVTVHKSIIRLSEYELPLLITFALSVLGTATWDGIKFCIRKLFNSLPPNRAKGAAVRIDIQQCQVKKQIIIGQQNVRIINYNAKTEQVYNSLEQVYEHLDDES